MICSHFISGANYIDVTTLGVTGDGTTDDTVAIQSALDTYDHLFFPNGTYKISDSITPSSNSSLKSDSAIIYVTQEYGLLESQKSGIFFDYVNNINMFGKWILKGDAPNSAYISTKTTTANPDQTYVCGILVKSDCHDIYFEDIEGYDFTGGVFEIGTYPEADESYDIRVDKIKGYDCWNCAVAITMGRDILMKDITTYGCISNTNFAQTGFDIEPDSAKTLYNIQIDNVLSYNNDTGISIIYNDINQKDVVISNLTSYTNNDLGIYLSDTINLTISNMDVYDNYMGVYMFGTLKNIDFVDGEIHNNTTNGINALMDPSLGDIAVAPDNFNVSCNVYSNGVNGAERTGIVIGGTATYAFTNFSCDGYIYDDEPIDDNKSQAYGIDITTGYVTSPDYANATFLNENGDTWSANKWGDVAT